MTITHIGTKRKKRKIYLLELEVGDRRLNGVGKMKVMMVATTDEDSGSNEKRNGRVREKGVFG